MIIHQCYYNENSKSLYIEFSTKKDSDQFYRVLELDYKEVQYYSPIIITKEDLRECDESFLIDLIEQYLTENDLPEERYL